MPRQNNHGAKQAVGGWVNAEDGGYNTVENDVVFPRLAAFESSVHRRRA
jgi:hypothetical protein